MSVPVFVSKPTSLSAAQGEVYDRILKALEAENLSPITVAASDYPQTGPVGAVATQMKKCRGVIILGFTQMIVTEGIRKPGTNSEAVVNHLQLPSPWNNLEGGIAFGLGLPMLIFREEYVEGGLFDAGSTDQNVHLIEFSTDWTSSTNFKEPFESWLEEVRLLEAAG